MSGKTAAAMLLFKTTLPEKVRLLIATNHPHNGAIAY